MYLSINFLRSNRVYGACALTFRKALVRHTWDHAAFDACDTYDLSMTYMAGGEL